MTRRLLSQAPLLTVIALCALIAAVGCSSQPAPEEKPAEKPAAAPPPAPRPAAPAPESKAPAERKPVEPRPRAEAPKPAPAPEPAPAPAPAADAAMIEFTADVPDAQVFVDRVFLGKAPLTTTDVKPGSHRLNVSAAGFEGVAQTIEVKPGMQQIGVKLREVRLDVNLAVIHKHRMGNCKGRLVATAKGIRYETTDKDDAFTSPLLDLVTFEVDYLEKNLRVKLKNGKQLNFTDPEGNADRLFVFHRDVEKARERLRKGDTPAE
ncbi:MAG: PEGA domain-containing protein [Vicinamibacterales bacterium]